MLDISTYGSGRDVVALHGLPVPPESLAAITDNLAESYRVVVPDLFGLGKAPGEAIEELASTLRSLNLDTFAVVGHSFGAYQAFQLALHYDLNIEKIFALSPLVYYPEDVLAGYRELADAIEAGLADPAEVLLDLWFTPQFIEDHPEVAPMLRRWLDELGIDGLLTAARTEAGGPDLRSELGDLDIPVGIRVGSRDGATPPEWSREIAELLPRARLEVVDGKGHFLQYEDPKATVAAVVDFLAIDDRNR